MNFFNLVKYLITKNFKFHIYESVWSYWSIIWNHHISIQSLGRVRLCDPMDCSMTGILIHHQLLNLPKLISFSRWCHPTISSSVVPFSSCPQSFPASGSFQMSQFFASGGQSIGASASTSIFPMNTQDWPPLGWTGWISLQSKGLSRVFSNRKTNLTPYWICSLAITLVLYCLCLVMLVLYLLLKNVAYSMKYTR